MKNWSVKQRKDWDKAISHAPDGGLLQSWLWGDFQESFSNPVYNLSDENNQWFAQCVQLRAGSQWIFSIPRGPVYAGENPDEQSLQAFLKELKEFAKQKGCFLLRFDPPYTPKQLNMRQIAGVKKSLKELQPVHTLIVDTTPDEEALFAQMKPKWRYNIRLAQKKGVRVRWGVTSNDAQIFSQLMEKTTDRQKFASYDETYFVSLLTTLAKHNQGGVLIAERDGKPIAAVILAISNGVVSYLHGASDYTDRSLMAPHLLQWEAIKKAKELHASYDFWGVATDPPSNKAEEQWAGVTRFKKGFAPNTETTEYVGTYELAVHPVKYILYRLRAYFA